MATLHLSGALSSPNAPTEMDKRILGYLERTKKDYYDEEIADDPHFQVWYQLSSLRTGLFSWYPFRPDARLLEIGAGFGPLTGLLCDRCSQVVATERSAVRASGILKRWKEKENLQIYAGEWSELDLGGPFDYILLTGILERACGVLEKGSSPFEAGRGPLSGCGEPYGPSVFLRGKGTSCGPGF